MLVDPSTSTSAGSTYAVVYSLYDNATWKALLHRYSGYPMPPTGYEGRLYRLANGQIHYTFTPFASGTTYSFNSRVFKNGTQSAGGGVSNQTSHTINNIGYCDLFVSAFSNLGSYLIDALATNDIATALAQIWEPDSYPINYTLANCTVSAPSTASPGSDVVIQITPSSGYIFKGSSGVDIRDSDGIRVPFIVNGNQVAFTMPQP